MHKKLILAMTILGVTLLTTAGALALFRLTAPTHPAETVGAHTKPPRHSTSQPATPTQHAPATTPTSSISPAPVDPARVPSGTALTAPGTQLDSGAMAAVSIQNATAIYYLTIQADAPEQITGQGAAAAREAAHQPNDTTVYRAKITASALTGTVTIPTTAMTDITITTHPGSSELANTATLPLERDAGLQGDSLTVTTSKAATWYVYAFSADGNTPIGVQYGTPTGQYAAPITWVDPAGKQIHIP